MLYLYSSIRNIYINTKCFIIVVDRKFIKVNLSYVKIRTIALSAIIKSLGKVKYQVN